MVGVRLGPERQYKCLHKELVPKMQRQSIGLHDKNDADGLWKTTAIFPNAGS